MNKIKQTVHLVSGLAIASTMASAAVAADDVRMSSGARITTHDSTVFKSNPPGPESYDYEAQLEIYGGKRQVKTPRAPIEWGRDIYNNGTFSEESYAFFGRTNPSASQFVVYGDVRTAVAHNHFGNDGLGNDIDLNRAALKATLDFDWKMTATERIHAAITPFDDGRDITRVDRGSDFFPDDDEVITDFNADSFFFEGDLGAILAGWGGKYSKWDMPIAFGLMPLQFQNAIWMDDAITGVAVSMIAKNSRSFDISNYDITFFAGFDNVNTPFVDSNGEVVDTGVGIYGIATFFDANRGYWEIDYAYTDVRRDDPLLEAQAYHNFAIGFTRRYGAWLSNSTRLIANFGQDVDTNNTAEGVLFLLENSLITSMPYTLIPYFNLFVSKDNPQALARAGGAGGILKNVGITFESDNMTGFPTMVASGRNMVGGALGVEYLFGLNRQLVVELAVSDVFDDQEISGLQATGQQVGGGIRYQHNLSRAWLVRLDAVYVSNELIDDEFGVRIEFRRKF